MPSTSSRRTWLMLASTATPTAPFPEHSSGKASPKNDAARCNAHDFVESQASRAAYTFISLLCMTILGGLISYRVRQIDRRKLTNLCFTHLLICILYLLSICFVFAAAVAESGLGLTSLRVCRGAIFLCLGFYLASKIVVYLFLIERAHALRAPLKQRTRDWLWMTATTLILSGFGGIGIVALVKPVADMSPADGQCRIGIPRYVTIPLILYDVGINALLTITFVYLLGPLVRSASLPIRVPPAIRLAKRFSIACKQSSQDCSLLSANGGNQQMGEKLEKLLWKTFIGSVLAMIATVGNFAALSVLRGRELGWVCLMICTLDVVWTVAVFHWLTVGASETQQRQANE